VSESDLAIVAALVFAWGTLSARLERFDVTAPIIFVLAGVLLTHGPLATLGYLPTPELVKALAEVTLVLVLFSDASRVGLRELRADAGLYGRLLGVGLPLTIGLGTLLALALFGGMSIWLALLVGAALAPTDAALGAGMMVNPAVPARIRRLLNVESGLNDGIATPFVLVAIAGAQTAEHAHGTGPGKAVAELAVGLLVGAAVGSAGGWLIRLASRQGWAAEGFAGSAVLGLAICAYASALALHGNGFIAAFTGGLAYGAVSGRGGARLVPFVEETGALVSLLVWLSFGAVAVVAALQGLTWQVALYAVLSLTVIRMAPTALALAGARLGRPAVVLVGWFGPRGLASVVFALLALEEIGQPAASQAVAVITATVLLSVLAHGASADPLARRFGPRLAPAADGAEHPGLPDLPERRLIRRAPAAASGTGADPARQAGDQPASGSDRLGGVLGVLAGQRQHLVDVPGGVVVGEDRAA
jgi:NhaP-type Na+/H+ or K+/H+ antiporter